MTNTAENSSAKETRQPDLVVYSEKQIGRKSYLKREGVAFMHNHNGGYNVFIDFLGMDIKLVLLPPKDNNNTDNN